MNNHTYIFKYRLPRDLHRGRRSVMKDLIENAPRNKYRNVDKIVSSLMVNAINSLVGGSTYFRITLNREDFSYIISDNKKELIPFSCIAFSWCIKQLEVLGYVTLEKGFRSYVFRPKFKIKGLSGFVITETKQSTLHLTEKFLELFPEHYKDSLC